MKEFQTTAIELCKQPKILKQKKEYIRLVIVSIEVDVVTKIDDEVYVLSVTKIYSYFSFAFSALPKKVELLKILKVMQLL